MFRIIVVSLNPGHKPLDTMKSVAEQCYTDYEVIVKDGGSKDDSLAMRRKFCIYRYSLFARRGYETKYRTRADYEHFL